MTLRYSNLKYFAQSAAHYQENLRRPKESTREMRIGTAVHYKLLGGKGYVVYPGSSKGNLDRQGNEWKAFAAEYGEDQDILTVPEENEAVAIAAAAREYPMVQDALTASVLEGRITWRWMGRDISSTLDIKHPDVVTEVKISMTSHPDKIWAHARNQLWFAQLAFYQMGVEAATGVRPQSVRLIAIEKRTPHVTTVFEVDERDLEDGRRMCRSWMEQLISCEESNHWPGYVQSTEPVKLRRPEWAERGVAIVDDDEEGEE